MVHAESPSLISLGLAANQSEESSAFRWGIAASVLLHGLILLIALSLRFQAPLEKPFRAIDVAMISLKDLQMPSSRPKAPSAPPVKKARAPKPKAQPKPQPVEQTLPPLPTETSSERLSEAIGGAVDSIVVPEQRTAQRPTARTPNASPAPSPDNSPLIEDLHLPSAAPKLARPQRLDRSTPVTIPEAKPVQPNSTPAPTVKEHTSPAPATQVAKVVPKLKTTPAPPALKPVTPFKKTESKSQPPTSVPQKTLEESIKGQIPSIPTAPLKQRIPLTSKTTRKRKKPTPSSPPMPAKPRPQETHSSRPKAKKPTPQKRVPTSVPKVAAPELAKIPAKPTTQSAPAPKREKLSDSVKQLLGSVTIPTLKPTPPPSTSAAPPPQPTPSKPSTPAQPVPSAIDQRIAKLTIPEVSPVESIKKRLKLLEVQSSSSSGAQSAGPSPGESRYLAMVEDAIDRQWVAPPLLQTTPTVILKFRISRSGEISNIMIDEGSGNEHYDFAALRAVRAVNPLPAFPPEIEKSYLDLLYRFQKTE